MDSIDRNQFIAVVAFIVIGMTILAAISTIYTAPQGVILATPTP